MGLFVFMFISLGFEGGDGVGMLRRVGLVRVIAEAGRFFFYPRFLALGFIIGKGRAGIEQV